MNTPSQALADHHMFATVKSDFLSMALMAEGQLQDDLRHSDSIEHVAMVGSVRISPVGAGRRGRAVGGAWVISCATS